MTERFNHIAGLSASELLNEVELTEPPFDPFDVASRLFITVDEKIDLDRMSISGEIGLDESREPIIWINPLDPPNRRRFTMAHELGHLVNDILPHISQEGVDDKFSDPEMNLRRDGRQDPREFAANEFAADLLMPKEHIIQQAKKIINAYQKEKGEESKMPVTSFIAGLTSIFEVSQVAMDIRLKRMNIIK